MQHTLRSTVTDLADALHRATPSSTPQQAVAAANKLMKIITNIVMDSIGKAPQTGPEQQQLNSSVIDYVNVSRYSVHSINLMELHQRLIASADDNCHRDVSRGTPKSQADRNMAQVKQHIAELNLPVSPAMQVSASSVQQTQGVVAPSQGAPRSTP